MLNAGANKRGLNINAAPCKPVAVDAAPFEMVFVDDLGEYCTAAHLEELKACDAWLDAMCPTAPELEWLHMMAHFDELEREHMLVAAEQEEELDACDAWVFETARLEELEAEHVIAVALREAPERAKAIRAAYMA